MTKRLSWRGWLLGVAGLLLACMLLSLLLALTGLEVGPVALVVGVILATLPVPLYAGLALWLDRYEPEPKSLLLFAFIWGATVATFVSYILNSFSGYVVASLFNEQAGEFFSSVFSAPIVEETSKGLMLLLLFFWKKDEFDNLLDGIIYATMVGLGFAMTENILYYGRGFLTDMAPGAIVTFVLRGVLSPYAHPLFTLMIGAGLGLARQTRHSVLKWMGPLAGYILAMSIHSLWNLSSTIGGLAGFLLTFLFVMIPLFLSALLLVFLALRREAQVLRKYLALEVGQRLLTDEDYAAICSTRGRVGQSLGVLLNSGVRAWLACRRWQHAASELAFYRWRVERGVVPADPAVERDYEETLRRRY